ncbi:MAG: T9SS type A sorting domain-containing protein [Bacteroidia bacterium]
MSKHLQNYFDAAKQQAPLLTEKEVANLLNTAPKVVVKKRFLNLKRFVFMSTLSVMITAIWLMWNNQNVSTIKPQATTSLKQVAPTQPQPNNTTGLIEKPVLNRLQLSPTKPQQVTPDSLNKPQEPNKITSWFEPKNSNSYIEPQEPTREYFNENGELMLTHEELAKLGIITDGNVLSYEIITDSANKYRYDTITKIETPTYSLKIGKSGSSSSIQNSTEKVDTTYFKNFHAIAIEDSITNKVDEKNRLTFTEMVGPFGYRLDYFNELKPSLVPLMLELKAKGKIYNSDRKLVFWFKNEISFIQALPDEMAKAVEEKYGKPQDKNYFADLKGKYQKKSPPAKGFDSLTIKLLQNSYVKIQPEFLREINIKHKGDKLRLVYWESKLNKAKTRQVYRKTIYKSKANYTSIMHGIPTLINQKKGKIKVENSPIAESNYNLSRIDFLRNVDDSIGPFMDNPSYNFFKQLTPDLYPIMVDSQTIFWFYKNEKLNTLIQKSAYKRADLNLRKINKLSLTPSELKNLNISYEPNGIRVPTLIDKTSSIYSVYNNYESTHDIVGFKVVEKDDTPTFEPDSLAKNTVQNTKVPTPVLITSLDGIGWRAYEYDIDKFIDQKEVAYMKEHNLSPEKHQPYIEAVEKAKQALIRELSTMLPIAIVHPTLKNTGIIAWYRTDSTLFNLLPAELAIDIKREASAITNNQQTLTCKYFETCNTASMLYDVYAFPNPTEQMVTVEIEAMEPRNYGIVLTDIEGKVVKTLAKNKTLKSGKHQLPFDLADMAPGMYLLQVNTQYNELTVKRIIKK